MKRLLTIAVVLGFLGVLALLAAGSLRYGGPAGFLFRVQAEFAGRRPVDHPLTVPTPLPTATALPVAAATATSAPSSTPTRPAAATRKATATPMAAATASPAATATASPPTVEVAEPVLALDGFRHAWQTWNNCGPATLSTYLSFFGSGLTQEQIRLALRPNRDDKNVNLAEMADFARQQGLQARVLVNGDSARVRSLLGNGYPLLVETWLEPEPNDGMGHYRLLTGYDDRRQEWIAYDSYVATSTTKSGPYTPLRIPYDEFEALWRVFNRTYLVLYPEDQAAEVMALLGEDADEQAMWARSLSRADTEAAANPQDAYAWFNMGTSLTALGRYEEAAAAYDRARTEGLPWRMLWYQFGPFQAYFETGRFQEVVALAEATLRTTESVEELHYWRGKGLEGLGQTAAAEQAYRRAIEFNPGFAPADAALAGLTGG